MTGLLAKAEATVLIGTRVKSISKNIDCPDKNVVVYETSDNQEVAVDNFDYVLVGLPLYEGVLGADFSLDFEGRDGKSWFNHDLINPFVID